MLSRRTLLKGFCVGGALALVQSKSQLRGAQEHSGIRPTPIWDVHTHLTSGVSGNTPEERMAELIKFADRLGIERLIVSHGYLPHGHPRYAHHNDPQQLRDENDQVMRAARHFPGRAFGSVYLNPNYPDFCLREFNRCVRDGPMIGVGELETDIRCNSPKLDPIVERAVSMKVPILQHTFLNTTGNRPGESTPNDLAELAKRHPQAQFICGHTGGNWELGIRAIRNSKNVCAGISGSDSTSGFVEMAVRELGAERVIFGSDAGGRSFAQLAKVIGADVPDSAKELILGGNARRLYEPILRAKGMLS